MRLAIQLECGMLLCFLESYSFNTIIPSMWLWCMPSCCQHLLLLQVGGLLLVAPEHRLSMQLKRGELWREGRRDICAALDELALDVPYCDILDENDVLLHHR